MKRLLLLTILIGLLFTSPNSFAQSSKPKRATINTRMASNMSEKSGKAVPRNIQNTL